MIGLATSPTPCVSVVPHGVPPGSWDTHSHVFGPFELFPPVRHSVYALPNATPRAHAALRRALGMTFGVLTQPAPYADEPAAMMSAIGSSQGALRGVAVATPEVDDSTLAQWRTSGIVGLRFTQMRAPNGQPYPGSVPFDAVEELAGRMVKHGFHAQLWGSAADFTRWLPRLTALGVPLVLDHMGSPDTQAGVKARDFEVILETVSSRSVWVKLVLARVAKSADCADARPFHEALIAAAPDRMLWGSDWPYVRIEPAPDAADMLRRFLEWTPDSDIRRAVLVSNPAKLYELHGEIS